MKKYLFAVFLAASMSANAAGLHEAARNGKVRILSDIIVPAGVTKAYLQDGALKTDRNEVDSSRGFCEIELRHVWYDWESLLPSGAEFPIAFVSRRWADFPEGAANVTTLRPSDGLMGSLSCRRPGSRRDPYLTTTEFEAVAGGYLAVVSPR